MADRALIDHYLGELRREVRWIRHAEDIVEEVADHLLEAVASLTRAGVDGVKAQQSALSEFGDPELVGRAFASSTTGGIAVPTQFTTRSGIALIASSFLWLTAFALFYLGDVLDRTRPWEGLPQQTFLFGALSLMVAGVLMAIGTIGIVRRHGGALGTTGRIIQWIAVFTAVTAFGSWLWGPWLTSLGVGAALLAASLADSDIAPRFAGWMVGLGGVFAAGSAWGFEIFRTEDVSLGDDVAALLIAGGLAFYSIGLLLLGNWLRSEEPADESELTAAA